MSELDDVRRMAIAKIGHLMAENERLTAENERLRAFIADRLHDATREEMMVYGKLQDSYLTNSDHSASLYLEVRDE